MLNMLFSVALLLLMSPYVKKLSEQIYDFTECIDNWVIKDNYEKIDHQNNHKNI